MKEFKEICGGREECTSQVTKACNCGNTVILLCQDCVTNHVLDPHPHMFIELELARQLLTETIPSEKYEEWYTQYLDLKEDVLSYIKRLQDYKTKICSFKAEIIQQIEASVQLNIQKIDLLIDHSNFKLDQLNKSMTHLSQPDRAILPNYKTPTILAFLQNYADSFTINDQEIKHAINHMITIHTHAFPLEVPHASLEFSSISPSKPPRQTSQSQEFIVPSSQKSIFTAKLNTKDLIKYDFDLNTISTYSIDSSVQRPFQYSSTCILPTGQILIAGGYKIGHTYRVDINKNSPECIRLSDLNYPRGLSKLICYKDSVYIFGGNSGWGTSKKAEKMAIGDSSWIILPNMKESREDFGVYISEDRIYILGGLSNTSIEYYDIEMNMFYLLGNAQVPKGGLVCGEIDNSIYAVGFSHILEYSKDFQLIETRENVKNRFPHCYSEVLVGDGKLIYVNSAKSKVYAYDVGSRCLVECKEF